MSCKRFVRGNPPAGKQGIGNLQVFKLAVRADLQPSSESEDLERERLSCRPNKIGHRNQLALRILRTLKVYIILSNIGSHYLKYGITHCDPGGVVSHSGSPTRG